MHQMGVGLRGVKVHRVRVGLMGACDLSELCSLLTAENQMPPRLLPLVFRRMERGARAAVRCLLLLQCLCFEGKYGAVAGLVHAFGSWQRCFV